jgi:integrase/recombinase XerD
MSRTHTDADLRMYLTWRADRGWDPFAVRRLDVERYVRWLQETRRLQPSTVSGRLSVVIGFYGGVASWDR